MATYNGRCLCGAVSATINAEPVAVRHCLCRQCQKLSGGAGGTNAMFPTESIAMHGALGSFAYTAASGNKLTQYFCASCGTPVIAESSARPQFRTIRLGFIDNGQDLAPRAAIWTDEAPNWARFDPEIEHHPQQPPPPKTA